MDPILQTHKFQDTNVNIRILVFEH